MYFYTLYCFTFSVKHLILSVIIFVHIRHICMHVLKMLQALLPWTNNGCRRCETLPLFRKLKTGKNILAKGLHISQNATEYAWSYEGKSLLWTC